jgi:hypothetical protein
LGDAFDPLLTGAWAEEHGELVAAYAGYQIGALTFRQKSASDLDQTLVAGAVAEGIVDHLEPVEVDEHQGAPSLLGATDFCKSGLKLGAVGKAGHHIVLGDIPHMVEKSLLLGNVLLDPEEPYRFAVSAFDGG